MMEQLLSRFNELNLEPTGEFEVSGFQAVDGAIAAYISRMFDKARVNTKSFENASYIRFIGSPAANRVVLGKFDDIVDFLKSLRRSDAWKAKTEKPKNPQVLPVINVSRSFDTAFMGIEHKRDTPGPLELEVVSDGDDKPYSTIGTTNASLTYSITILAAEKETLSLLINTIGASFRFAGHRSLSAPIKLALVETALDATFTDSRDIAFNDISAPIGEERIFAAQAVLTVSADVKMAMAVNPRKIRHEVVTAVKED
ncbi:hypothetical protein KGP26_29845 (plasmid) [Serratia sp. JSRIV002]|uniref:hypothetical protein n=1 Tax=Serratia sp. JSRIV002 TaxID=2831894 RepID=UPI001CBFE730|nr:hypothetical protein [Serratia sp. JSRIV002]UAN54752.1 hypothetical protein KGP26_29845 [Serratia sp. JSRIV002]